MNIFLGLTFFNEAFQAFARLHFIFHTVAEWAAPTERHPIHYPSYSILTIYYHHSRHNKNTFLTYYYVKNGNFYSKRSENSSIHKVTVQYYTQMLYEKHYKKDFTRWLIWFNGKASQTQTQAEAAARA